MDDDDDMDINDIIAKMENTNLFDSNDEYSLLATCFETPLNAPNVKDILYQTVDRYKRYLRHIEFTDEFDYLIQWIHSYLQQPFIDMTEKYNLMKKIDGTLLYFVNQSIKK